MSEEGADNPGFLSRWSRRKQKSDQVDSNSTEHDIRGTQAEAENLFESSPVPVSADPGHSLEQAAAGEVTESVLTDDDMPPVESLDKDSDYSPFLSEGVSKELRNLALKKLFFSGKFAIRDGLDDYDDDFTRFEPLGDTITSDMKFHQRRKERERLAKLEEEAQQKLNDESEAEDESAPIEHGEDEHIVDTEGADSAPGEERSTGGEQPLGTQDDLQSEFPALQADNEHQTDSRKITAGGGKLKRKNSPDNPIPEGKTT